MDSLAPGLLVASPTMTCPFFGRTVVLMVDHGEEGSFGFVVNKSGELPLDQVMSDLGYPLPAPTEADVMLGGPVSPEIGWVVYDPRTSEHVPEDIVEVNEGLAVTASLSMLQAISDSRGPSAHLLALGYSGWSPGQLDDELREGSWIPIDADPGLIFDVAMEDRWTAALRTMGIDPARMVSRRAMA